MPDIGQLATAWRQEAEELTNENCHTEAALLCQKADDVEQAWHDYAHDGSWYPEECTICVQEMRYDDYDEDDRRLR